MDAYNRNQVTPRAMLVRLTIIYVALFVGQVFFAVIALFIHSGEGDRSGQSKFVADDVFIYLVPIITVASQLLGNFILKKMLKKTTKENTLTEKLTVYQSALIVRLALAEGASLFALVVYSITGNLIFIAIAAFNILWFVQLKPTADKVSDDMALSPEERLELGI